MKAHLLAFGFLAFGLFSNAQKLTAQEQPVAVSSVKAATPCVASGPAVSELAVAAACPKVKDKAKKKKPLKKLPPLPAPVNPMPDTVYQYMTSTSQVDPLLVLAICATESSFHSIAKAIGQGVGHYGLMQIALGTAQLVGFKGKAEDLYNWQVNVKFGARYIAKLQSRYKDRDSVISAYNAGRPILHKARKGKPQTFCNQGYVNRVKSYYLVFSRIYGTGSVAPGKKAEPLLATLAPVNH